MNSKKTAQQMTKDLLYILNLPWNKWRRKFNIDRGKHILACFLSVNCTRVDGHKSKSSSVRKHYNKDYAGAVPEDLLSCFRLLKKWKNKFDCLVNEMLYIKQLRPPLNVQTDSIRAKVFV